MEFLFLSLYDYFKKNRSLLYGIFMALFLLIGVGATQVKVEEDIARFFPNNKKLEKINQIFKHSKFMKKLVVMVSMHDSTKTASPHSIIRFTDELINRVQTDLATYLTKITYKANNTITFHL